MFCPNYFIDMLYNMFLVLVSTDKYLTFAAVILKQSFYLKKS